MNQQSAQFPTMLILHHTGAINACHSPEGKDASPAH